jgi:putative transposase
MRTSDGYRRLRKRYEEPGHARYLTFSCFRNQAFLGSERARGWLLEAVLEARAKYGFCLWAWVFMPDHVHMLILPKETRSVSGILQAIKEPVAKKASYWVKKNAPQFLPHMLDVQPSGRRSVRFWQPGGGYDRNIITVAELREKITYVHNNPVRRSLVGDPKDWVWSSFHAWEAGEDVPLPIDRASVPPLNA